MKKLKLFLVSSVLAVSFLSNPVNAMEPDEDVSESKSPAVPILDLSEDCTAKILSELPLRDVVSFALTSKKASQLPCYGPMWFQTDGTYGKSHVNFDRWSSMLSPLFAAARHQRDFDQFLKVPEFREEVKSLLPSTLDLRLAVMDNLPSFHSQKNFTFQINGEQWTVNNIYFNDFKVNKSGFLYMSALKGNEITMDKVLDTLKRPCIYNIYNPSNPAEGAAQFGEDQVWGYFTLRLVK